MAKPMGRRTFAAATAASLIPSLQGGEPRLPNIVVILADDLGYGDLGCYGSRIATPNLDHMAQEGVLFRHFYAGSPVCSPSRAALMTGRYPTRVGVPNVLVPDSKDGLAENEATMANVLKPRGYRTSCIGKWHLGSQPQYLPTRRGFDEYFGIPYSHDMWPPALMLNDTVIEQPANLNTLAARYTQHAVDFIGQSGKNPFFLYLAHHAPHLPLAASDAFRGTSLLGPYADVVRELDWSVGQVLGAIRDNGLDQDTLVMFTSDNGPWFQGAVGGLHGRKGETWDGGLRVPFLARWPGRIPAGQICDALSTVMDLLPTAAGLSGAALPPSPLDGVDIQGLLTGAQQDVQRQPFLFFDSWNLQCARLGRWKIHLTRYNSPAWGPEPVGGRFNLALPATELYDLSRDPEESYDVASFNPDVVADLRARVEAMIPGFPKAVQDLWGQAMSTPVLNTPSGALPVKSGS